LPGCFGPELSQRGSRNEVALNIKCIVDGGMDAEVASPPQDVDPGVKIRFQAKGFQFGRWSPTSTFFDGRERGV
jgi:hypothetical protein